MNYALTNKDSAVQAESVGMVEAGRKLWPFIAEDGGRLLLSLFFILLNSGLTIAAPFLISRAIDRHLVKRDIHGVYLYCAALIGMYVVAGIAGFFQTRVMGRVGQGVLFRLRNALISKLEDLPLAFFSSNKAGDLISRINNDTDKLNQFFSRSLMQFVGNVFVIIGAGIAMLLVDLKLGSAALLPAVGLLIITRLTSGWIKKTNFKSLQTLGGLSGEIQESFENFKVIIAFNRRDYFRNRFQEVNETNYKAALAAGIANNTYAPVYAFATNLGTLIVITYGLSLIGNGALTFGVLISFLTYVTRFYSPLQQMASLWSDLQTALAGWDRISEILGMESNLKIGDSGETSDSLLEFRDVSFGYSEDKKVLNDVNLKMETGKIYALVGPTGGGKTTTASLIARLYDPTEGTVLLGGRDIRSFDEAERSKKIGFILQDPFLFAGTVRENIVYGNEEFVGMSEKELEAYLKNEGLEGLLHRFDEGLSTVISGGDGISLGQKQLIAFMRAVLRHPDLLILDEATANVDTVTEQLLDEILSKLPKSTTTVIIAHRLNTIAGADEIFFVNAGKVTAAGSLEQAVAMLESGARKS
jgi:ATP-binding cassette, subfamily B, bacterial